VTGAVDLLSSQQIDNAIKESLVELFVESLDLEHPNFGPQHQVGITIFSEGNYATEKHENMQSPFQRSIGDNCHVKVSVFQQYTRHAPSHILSKNGIKPTEARLNASNSVLLLVTFAITVCPISSAMIKENGVHIQSA
jgi:hypothetical protein